MFGIQVKTADMKRAVWLSPRGTTRLVIHASEWPTREAALAYAERLTADPRNSHLTVKVKRTRGGA